MDFIKQQYEEYQTGKKIAGFVVAFSGGKDSQVTLDLVSRVIPHEKFTVCLLYTSHDFHDIWPYDSDDKRRAGFVICR